MSPAPPNPPWVDPRDPLMCFMHLGTANACLFTWPPPAPDVWARFFGLFDRVPLWLLWELRYWGVVVQACAGVPITTHLALAGLAGKPVEAYGGGPVTYDELAGLFGADGRAPPACVLRMDTVPTDGSANFAVHEVSHAWDLGVPAAGNPSQSAEWKAVHAAAQPDLPPYEHALHEAWAECHARYAMRWAGYVNPPGIDGYFDRYYAARNWSPR